MLDTKRNQVNGLYHSGRPTDTFSLELLPFCPFVEMLVPKSSCFCRLLHLALATVDESVLLYTFTGVISFLVSSNRALLWPGNILGK